MSEERVGGSTAETRGIGHTICGLLAAPIVGGMIASTLMILLASILTPSSNALMMLHVSILAGLIAGAIFGVPAALLVGWPVHLLMKWRGVKRRHHYMLVGALIAVLPLAVSSGSALLASPNLGVPLAISFLLAGAIGGVTFWLIRRPDRDMWANST